MNTRPDSSPSPRPHRIQPRPLQPGTHLARCSAVIDLGTHTEPVSSFKSQVPSSQRGASGQLETLNLKHETAQRAKRRLLLTFTLFAQDGSTQRLSRQFTHSCDVRSSLAKFLTPWLGQSWKQPSTTVNHGQPPSSSLRVSAIAEMPCLLVLQPSEAVNPATGQPWLNITSASPLIAGLEVPDLKWPATIFSLKAPNREVFQHLPAWIQTKIRASHEWSILRSSQSEGGQSLKQSSSSSSIKAPQLTHA